MDAPEFTADQALAFLRERNVDLQAFASRPEVFDRTCTVVYKALPLPLRLALGRQRVERVLGAARDLYVSESGVASNPSSGEGSPNVPSDGEMLRDGPMLQSSNDGGRMMPTAPAIHAEIKSNRMLSLYQPALDESLEALADGESLLLYGLANVGNCDGYYFITDRGVHYCEKEKSGAFKKRYVARLFSKEQMASAVVDQMGPPQFAYLRIFDENKKMLLVMMFQDEFSDSPALHQAEAAAQALGFG